MKTDDKIIDKIKKIMSENESLYKVSPSLFDPLFEAGEIVTFPRGYMIMKAGRQLRDVYVIIDGLVGSFYESGSKVILHGLATPGTLLIHGASFFNVKPSFMHWEAVVATTVLRVPDSFIREYLHSCHEFAIWMYGMAENVIMYSEDKAFILSDSAEHRYIKLYENLPRRVFRELPSRMVARYLGITEQSLSRIKRSVLKNHPNKED